MNPTKHAAVLVRARERLGLAAAEDYVRWAVEALEAEKDSPALRELAGADLEGPARVAACSELFRVAVAELGIPIPSGDEAVREYVRVLALAIVSGKASPQEQVARIHREVLSPLNHPEDLMIWCYLDDGLRPREFRRGFEGVHFDSVEGQALDAAILEGAKWYLQVHGAAEQAHEADKVHAREES